MFEERGYVPFRRHAQPTIVSNYPWDSFESPLVGLRGGWGTRYRNTYKYNMDSQTNKQLKTPGKRLLTSSNESSPSNEQTTNIRDLCATDAWPRFLVMESTTLENSLSRLSPFVIEKAMKGICDVVDCKKLRGGALLIEVSRPAQATNLLKQTTFAMVPIKVTPHRTMNSCKGVIRDRDLADMDTAELVQELSCVGVIDAKNIFQTRNQNKIKTASIILTFARSILPKSINAGYTKIRVQPYIPNPLRCFTCQGFGHHQSTCKRNKICARCGQPDHGTDTCMATPHCSNCNGDHPAYATSCPKWEKEKEICRIKVLQNITFPEARKMVYPVANESNNRITYSAMARPGTNTTSVGTQTDITNCTCKPNLVQNDEINTVNKVTKTLKQASNQTDDVESFENKNCEEIGNSSQQGEQPWIKVGRSGTHSLSPPSKHDKRGQGQRGKAGEPPDKQFRGSQSPRKSVNTTKKTTDDRSLGAVASSCHTSAQGARQKIGYPKDE